MAAQKDPAPPPKDEFTPAEKAKIQAVVSEMMAEERRKAPPAPQVGTVQFAASPVDMIRLKAFLTRLVEGGILHAGHGEVRLEAEQLLAALGPGPALSPATAKFSPHMIKTPVPFEIYAAAERLHNRVGYREDLDAVMAFVKGDRVKDPAHAVRAIIVRANEWGITGGPEEPARPAAPVHSHAGVAPSVAAQFGGGIGVQLPGGYAPPAAGAILPGQSTVGQAFDPLTFLPPGAATPDAGD